MASKSSRKLKKKVPKIQHTLKVIHLHCSNCGEEDEKVLYCSHCDAPMDVVEVEERPEEEVENDVVVSKGKAGDDDEDEDIVTGTSGAVDEDVDNLIETGGLDPIYSEEDGFGLGLGGSDDDLGMNMDDAVSSLDDE